MTDTLWMLLWLVPAALTLQFTVIRREERFLEERFGDTYQDYKARVRRWV